MLFLNSSKFSLLYIKEKIYLIDGYLNILGINTSALRIGSLYIQRSVLVPISVRNYAARKGTRERKQKKKVKTEIKKIGFIPHNERNKEKQV